MINLQLTLRKDFMDLEGLDCGRSEPDQTGERHRVESFGSELSMLESRLEGWGREAGGVGGGG